MVRVIGFVVVGLLAHAHGQPTSISNNALVAPALTEKDGAINAADDPGPHVKKSNPSVQKPKVPKRPRKHVVPIDLPTPHLPLDLNGGIPISDTEGIVGFALNGVLMLGRHHTPSGQGKPTTWHFDNCGGHSDEDGWYHYHFPPSCLIQGANATAPSHAGWWYDANPAAAWPEIAEPSPILGFALDGVPIFGPYGPDGRLVQRGDLDSCGGRMAECHNGKCQHGDYVYHWTVSAPFLPTCFRGTPAPFERSGKEGQLCSPTGEPAKSWKVTESGRRTLLATSCPDHVFWKGAVKAQRIASIMSLGMGNGDSGDDARRTQCCGDCGACGACGVCGASSGPSCGACGACGACSACAAGACGACGSGSCSACGACGAGSCGACGAGACGASSCGAGVCSGGEGLVSTETSYSGYLIDHYCYNLASTGESGPDGSNVITGPEEHTLHCLRDLPVCRNGYYLAIDRGTAGATSYGIKFQLDPASQSGALALLDSFPVGDERDNAIGGFRVTATGWHGGDGTLRDATFVVCNAMEGCDGVCQVPSGANCTVPDDEVDLTSSASSGSGADATSSSRRAYLKAAFAVLFGASAMASLQ